jgi:hypothetical protein
MASRVDAAMNSMQAARGDTAGNRAGLEAQLHQLPAAYDTVLAVSHTGDLCLDRAPDACHLLRRI